MSGPEELTVGGDVAVRDYGGSGPPVLLLHGGGANLVSMQLLAQELTPQLHVVAVDLRGHGRSGDGPWEWDAVLGDLERVCGQLDLPEPAVVGWSLGGMIAALWADRHPRCPAAVSLDGTPPPSRPDQCAGLDPALARADLERLHAAFSAMRDSMARPLAPSDVEAALDQHRAMARRHGAPEEIAAGTFKRNLTTWDGQTWARPLPPVVAALQQAMADLDVIPVYRRVKCPLLVVLATDDLPEQQPFSQLYAAYRRGFESRLAEAGEANPRLRVVRVEGASHALVAERPAELARLVTAFTVPAVGPRLRLDRAQLDSEVPVKPLLEMLPVGAEELGARGLLDVQLELDVIVGFGRQPAEAAQQTLVVQHYSNHLPLLRRDCTSESDRRMVVVCWPLGLDGS